MNTLINKRTRLVLLFLCLVFTSITVHAQTEEDVLKSAREKYTNVGVFSEGLALVNIGGFAGKYGFINTKGQEIVPVKYEFAKPFSEGYAVVSLNGKMGFINKEGAEVIALEYKLAKSFKEGLALVMLDNRKMGFIDKNGKVVIPLIYDWSMDFSDGKTQVKHNGEDFYIDKGGKKLY